MSGPSPQALLSHFLGDEDDKSDWGRGLLGFKTLYGMMGFYLLPSPRNKTKSNCRVNQPSRLSPDLHWNLLDVKLSGFTRGRALW